MSKEKKLQIRNSTAEFLIFTRQAGEDGMPPLTRAVRAANAKVHINTRFSAKQHVFLDFVLSHYVTVGVGELDQAKLTPLLRLKYHDSIADAVADLGKPDEIGNMFAGFQKYLYQPGQTVDWSG